ncbi:MAG: hypothetical protein HC843_04570 [Sphingomonadales bacterium]|nr:hypothetical protein [Sphingomonadales bacterium]
MNNPHYDVEIFKKQIENIETADQLRVLLASYNDPAGQVAQTIEKARQFSQKMSIFILGFVVFVFVVFFILIATKP